MFEHLMNDHGEWNQLLVLVGDWPILRAYINTIPVRAKAVIGRLRYRDKAPKKMLDES